jgi:DNA repair exonuclease SbcCD ATPase subunit
MINTYALYEELAVSLGESPAKAIMRVVGRVYEDLSQTVTKDDFNRLANAVSELAEAQKRTEEKIEALAEAQRKTEERLNELAEAQKKTEERINELAKAQRKTEERLDRLSQRVEELAEAQRKTEERLDSLSRKVEMLAEAQVKVEEQIRELVESLGKLEKRVDELAEEQEKIKERLEGISNSVGYSLENSAYKALPSILEKYGIKVQGRLIRRYIGEHQVNIYGKATRNGQEVTILGECKVRPSRKEIKRFERLTQYFQKTGAISGDVVLVFVAHDYPPEIEKYLSKKNLLYFWSYEFGD